MSLQDDILFAGEFMEQQQKSRITESAKKFTTSCDNRKGLRIFRLWNNNRAACSQDTGLWNWNSSRWCQFSEVSAIAVFSLQWHVLTKGHTRPERLLIFRKVWQNDKCLQNSQNYVKSLTFFLIFEKIIKIIQITNNKGHFYFSKKKKKNQY